MKKLFFYILFLVAATAANNTATAQEEMRLLRFPTTNGSDIVFMYAGDLYRVPIEGGDAVRLTSHVGVEMFPRLSPDGRTIAFTGQYDGNTEIYSMPVTGGEPVRLTYTATNSRDDLGDRMGPNNITIGWTPDGRHVLYRNRIGTGFTGQLWLASRDGGLSTQVPLPEGGFASYSPDGRRLAYNRVMREFRTWKYYEGGMADDVWIYDPQAATVTNITNHRSQNIFPMWVGDVIFFASDRDRRMNIFAYDTRTGATEKVTHFEEFDVKFPSSWGNWIVFENGGYIYKMDARERTPRKVTVRLAADNVYARNTIKDGAQYVRTVSASPDGARVAVTTRGEVFDVPVTRGVTRNITRTPGAHEREAAWSPDGRHIAYISDRTGETEIWLQAADGGEPVQYTRGNDTYISSFEWSPDSRTIVFTDRRNRLRLLDIASRAVTTVIEDPAGVPRGATFSPDSRWLAYTRVAPNRFNIVYVYDIAARREYPVTDRWYSSSSPVFSTDGRYLFFSSARDFNPVYGQTEWNHTYSNMTGLYAALLRAEDSSPFIVRDPQVNAPRAARDEAAGGAVRIDTEGLNDRIIRIPVQGSTPIYATGAKVWYAAGGGGGRGSGGGGIRVYDLEKEKDDEVLASGRMRVTPGSKKALIVSGGKYYVIDIPQGRATLSDEINLADMKIAVDFREEWTQIFDEAWRAFRDGFYVENMHGVDWPAMKEKYGALLPYVNHSLDLNYLIGEMIGELNVGHAYVNPGELARAPRLKTGMLGAEFSRDTRTGAFRIDRILPGTSWDKSIRSPLTEIGIDVKEGEYIVAVDGIPTSTVTDIYALLVGKAGVYTELTVNARPQTAGARRITVLPIESEEPIRHWNWVQDNIRKVSEATDGRVGYIYIPDMGMEGLNEFAKHFYPQLDKEGLIIDDRANGGGNVSPMILERLAREPYRLTMNRHSNMVGTIPESTHVGPMVCLINKYSASDGDLFPWGFRELGLGKLIGTRTWGGIVGISSSLPFMDGQDLRVPFMTSFDMEGNWMIENEGIEPDIWVDNDPIREFAGEDQQLDRAIEEILKQLPNRRPLAPVPAPRVWNR
ncbi:MAG: PDZ domain-containing protein [Rikenellaceae bacterium]|nr:PDZ domain-containing protein [Rikenellaceae bacterium]MCL2693461.1 PDZ domain-containing protein [Rikenellaceae bacterium]